MFNAALFVIFAKHLIEYLVSWQIFCNICFTTYIVNDIVAKKLTTVLSHFNPLCYFHVICVLL